MKVVIIAGGKGTRISSITSEIPKSMIKVNGKPVLEHQIELAKRYGLTEFIIVIGHLGESIRHHFEDGSKFDVSITYYYEKEPLGTAGALPYLKEYLTDDFFVFYGDTIMDVDLDKMREFHDNIGASACLMLHPNDHPYDSDLVEIDEKFLVTDFFSKPHPQELVYRNLVNAALYILTPSIVDCIPTGRVSDFGKNIFPNCLSNGLMLSGYISTEYIKDMGAPERYQKVCRDMMSGKVRRLNHTYPRKAMLLDRDGVISKDVNLLNKPGQLELLPGASDAIKLINKSDFLAVIITNQSVVARNLCSIEDIKIIHNTLETILGRYNGYLDAIYFCPHHPDGGYPEENKEYKINCDCRKPKAGMLLKAAKDLNIDLKGSYMVGDRQTDIEAGINAGLKESYLIEKNQSFGLLNIVRKLLGYDHITNSL